jgi:hypothetical protein
MTVFNVPGRPSASGKRGEVVKLNWFIDFGYNNESAIGEA